jgi:hypothetical protein
MTSEEIQNHFEESCSRRKAFWEGVGKMDSDVLGHLINPAFMGGPQWPSLRQAFITVRRPSTTLVVSDGLSDPFGDPDESSPKDSPNGFGLEFYVESPGNLTNVKESWQFDLVYQVSQLAAEQGNLRAVLKKHGYLTTEVYDVRVPGEFHNAEERTGVFIGLWSREIPAQAVLSLETIDIVNLKLLTLKELEFAAQGGKEEREKLAELFLKQGNPTHSDLGRESVV